MTTTADPSQRLSHQTVLDRLHELDRLERASLRRRSALVWSARVLLLAVFLVAWELLSREGVINAAFFSRPSDIYHFVADAFTSGTVWNHLWVTLSETLAAFVLGSVAGIVFALVRVSSPFLADLTGPFITVLNSLPRVALAPMFVIWFGLGQSSKVALAVSLVVFIVMMTTEAGTRSIEPEYLLALRAMGASRAQTFRKVLLPGSVPAIFAGLRLAVVYSLLGVVTGEMLASTAGLGQQIQFYASTFRTEGVLGLLLILALLALALNFIVGLAESRLSRWR